MKKIILVILLTFSVSPSLAGVFDPLPADYESWSAQAQQAYLWEEKISAKPYSTHPSLSGSFISHVLTSIPTLISLMRLDKSFDHISDEIPKERISLIAEHGFDRVKFIHTYGTIAKVAFRATENRPYTGIYRGGVGLVRLSLAGPPSALGFTPGMALKFFIDGHPSVNLHVMNSVNGQGDDHNFFAKSFSNIIPKAKGFFFKFLESIFKRFVRTA